MNKEITIDESLSAEQLIEQYHRYLAMHRRAMTTCAPGYIATARRCGSALWAIARQMARILSTAEPATAATLNECITVVVANYGLTLDNITPNQYVNI